MSKTPFFVLRCDRCGFEKEVRGPGDNAGWGKVYATEPHPIAERGRAIGIAQEADDTCPGCTDQLYTWYATVGAVDQPAPATPPAPPPRPTVNLVSRKRAVELATASLKARVDLAMAAVREEPTAILSGDVVPGALFGINDTAEGLVDALLDQLGIGGYRRQ